MTIRVLLAEDQALVRAGFRGLLDRSGDIEVKWGVHAAGEKREQWAPDDRRTALVILVSGHFLVQLGDGSADLAEPGDYVMWGPGTGHSWTAVDDSVVMTVRWPSTVEQR